MTRKEFENILPTIRTQTFNIGYRFFGNRDDAEEVAQESLLRLWQYCQQLDSEQDIKLLATKVAKRVSIDIYRQYHKIETTELDNTSPPTADNSYAPDSKIITNDTQTIIDNSINQLQNREKQLIKLTQEDIDTTEIARQTNLPVRSVRSMIAMAKNKIKKNILKQQS